VNDQVNQRRSRLMLVFITVIFFGPLAVAALLYYGGSDFQPGGRTNAGDLLQPIVNVSETLGTESFSALTDGAGDGHWLLVYRNSGACDSECETALYRMRQSRTMLGRDMTRVVRVFLHGDIGPDTVFIETVHEGLIATQNAEFSELLASKRPAESASGGLYLIDPLGNLVMYFPPDLEPEALVGDIEHLLDLSRIG